MSAWTVYHSMHTWNSILSFFNFTEIISPSESQNLWHLPLHIWITPRAPLQPTVKLIRPILGWKNYSDWKVENGIVGWWAGYFCSWHRLETVVKVFDYLIRSYKYLSFFILPSSTLLSNIIANPNTTPKSFFTHLN